MNPCKILLSNVLDVSDSLGYMFSENISISSENDYVFPEILLVHKSNSNQISLRLIRVFDELCILHGRSLKAPGSESKCIILRLNPLDYIKERNHSAQIRHDKDIIGNWIISTHPLHMRIKCAFFFPLCFEYIQSPHMAYLPNHLLMQIFQNSQVKECVALADTCKSMHQMSWSDCLWKYLLIRDFKATISESAERSNFAAKEEYRRRVSEDRVSRITPGVVWRRMNNTWNWQPQVMPPPDHPLRSIIFHPQRGPMLPFPARPTTADLVPAFGP